MRRLLIGFLTLMLLAACGGGGGGSATPPLSGPIGGRSIPLQSGSTVVQAFGTISGLWGGGFTLDTGYPHGNIHIYVISGATQISGPAPYISEQVTVTGSGSLFTSITATTVTQGSSPMPSPSSTPSALPMPTPFVSSQGTVVSVSSTKLVIASGYPHGNIPVQYDPSLVSIGGQPALNSYVQISGTGSLSSNLMAHVITTWPAAPSSVVVSGTVTQSEPYGFAMNVDSSHPAVPVILNSSVVVAGGILEIGSMVKVSGVGSSAESITAVQIVVNNPTPQPSPNQTPTPTPGPISQTHVLTAAYLGGYYGTHGIAWSQATPYLNWALTGVQDANNIASVGIKTMFYTDPSHVQAGDPMYTTDETTFAHDCSGNRVTAVFNGITQYVMDVTSPSLASLYYSVSSRQTWGAHFDGLFEDNAGTMTGPPAYSAFPCNYSDSAWIAGLQSLSQAASSPAIFNGLSGLNGHDPSVTLSLLQETNVSGGTFEHCYTDDATAKAAAWFWQATENTEIKAEQTQKPFYCLERNSADAASSIDARLYAYASFLLTYDPATSTMWETFTSSGTNFQVFTEAGLVAMSPIVAAPAQVSSLQTNSGAFGREYARCYLAGNFVGPCAVAVNSDPQNTYPFPYPQYGHTLVLSGEGVLDGGTIAANGPAPANYMPPLSSAIVFP